MTVLSNSLQPRLQRIVKASEVEKCQLLLISRRVTFEKSKKMGPLENTCVRDNPSLSLSIPIP